MGELLEGVSMPLTGHDSSDGGDARQVAPRL